MCGGIYQAFHDFAGPVATIIAAAAAVLVTWRIGRGQLCVAQQQADTAKQQADIALDRLYKHKHDWSNRLIAGDSLLVMNSLLEKEGMAGQVQMVYLDPPYGVDYASNFQPFTDNRTVKDRDKDLSQEPETIRAFRDTWSLGNHSYLTYLRDRAKLARELLSQTGSIFVQIGDQNVHLVRSVLDEVFGQTNFMAQIIFRKKMMPLSKKPGCESMTDYILSRRSASDFRYPARPWGYIQCRPTAEKA